MNALQRLQNNLYPLLTIVFVLVAWQMTVVIWNIPNYILPAPTNVVSALTSDLPTILDHTKITVIESFLGFILAILLAFLLSVLMDSFTIVKKSLYPLLIISQTVPTIAIAPIIMIWFGFGILPKVLIIVLVCFFPIAVSLIDGFQKVDQDFINLFKTMKANKMQVLFHLKLPSAMVNFFSGLKIAATYMIMTAVISEWMGGLKGIGVYMVRAKSAYELDKMFASIFVIVILSIIVIYLIDLCAKKVTHWE
ncbi:ABC transporter permease [Psychrobacillus sp. BM2]|uniref:ABC transporter permease n=1 Tax=Psychrobacillus sp. BM2 TaxID=3400421 RepID=UPI003B0290E4